MAVLRYCLLGILLFLSACEFVPPPPQSELRVSNSSVMITADTPIRTLSVRNDGDAESILNWSIVTSTPALVVSPSSGALAQGQQRRVDVTVDRSKVPIADRIEETITLKSNGGEQTVYVTFSVAGTGLAACGTYPSAAGFSADSAPDLAQQVSYRGREEVRPYAADELLIKFKPLELPALGTEMFDLSGQRPDLARIQVTARLTARDYGFTIQQQASPERPALITIPAGDSPLELAKRLAADPRVLYAEPNYYLEPLLIPNDPLYSEQWNLSDFGLPQAWNLETGERDVVVAVIDSGVDMDHVDLAAKVLPGCDFFTRQASASKPALFGDNNPNPGLPNGGRSEHGTHVAGVAAAIGDNATGIAGVAYGEGVKILPVKIFDNSGGGAKISHLVNALYWSAGIDIPGVAPNPFPADIINMSLGADPSEIPGELQSIKDAAAAVRAQGVLMFAATANNGHNDRIYTPAADENVIAVGSVDVTLERSAFSNYNFNGPSVDLMAPGGFGGSGCPAGNIRSTFTDDDYGCLNGTSMSTPFVAGVAALIWSQNPSLSAEQVQERLFSTTRYDDTFMTVPEYGRGIVCADKALGAATLCGQ